MARARKQSGAAGPTYLDLRHETIAVTMAAPTPDHRTACRPCCSTRCRAAAGLHGARPPAARHGNADCWWMSRVESVMRKRFRFPVAVVSKPQRGGVAVNGCSASVKMVRSRCPPRRRSTRASCARAKLRSARRKRQPYLCVSWSDCCTNGRGGAPNVTQGAASARASAGPARQRQRSRRCLPGRCPVISVENAGPGPQRFDALVGVAELMAIPVLQGAGASSPTFRVARPLSRTNINRLIQGDGFRATGREPDALVPQRHRATSPAQCGKTIVALRETPLKTHMVYPDHGSCALPSKARGGDASVADTGFAQARL